LRKPQRSGTPDSSSPCAGSIPAVHAAAIVRRQAFFPVGSSNCRPSRPLPKGFRETLYSHNREILLCFFRLSIGPKTPKISSQAPRSCVLAGDHMRFAWVLLGSILCTTILLGLELSRGDTRLAFVLIVLIIVLVREHLSVAWWYRPFFLTWLGATFLVANWLQLRWGDSSEPALVTFGPAFLIMALYEVVRHRFTRRHATN
jgi:hypothetical protein